MRGLPCKGLVNELKERIHNFLSELDTISPICSRYTPPIDFATQAMILVHAFVQRIMQASYTTELIDETENYIKLSLSHLNKWDFKSKNKNAKPILIGICYCHVNLSSASTPSLNKVKKPNQDPC